MRPLNTQLKAPPGAGQGFNSCIHARGAVSSSCNLNFKPSLRPAPPADAIAQFTRQHTHRLSLSIIPLATLASSTPLSTTATSDADDTSNESQMAREYNRQMATAMQWGTLDPFEYHPQRGLYWHEVSRGLICGTQPRSSHDVSALAEIGVTHILNLQTDKDMQHWGVDIREIKRRSQELGVHHIRKSARDFDPHSLRKTLPSAVSSVRLALAPSQQQQRLTEGQQQRLTEGQEGQATISPSRESLVYVHCTAGLGRAPAVCIAYMHWFLGMGLDEAYKKLTDIRPCGPKRDAIRGATFDLLSGQAQDQFDHLGRDAWATLSDEDRYALQWRVLRSPEPPSA